MYSQVLTSIAKYKKVYQHIKKHHTTELLLSKNKYAKINIRTNINNEIKFNVLTSITKYKKVYQHIKKHHTIELLLSKKNMQK